MRASGVSSTAIGRGFAGGGSQSATCSHFHNCAWSAATRGRNSSIRHTSGFMAMLETETPHPDHPGLDGYETRKLVATLVDDQGFAAEAVKHAATSITRAVDAAVPRLEAG